MKTYRLTAIGDDGVERGAGILGTLNAPPGSILVISVPPGILDADIARLRQEWREMTENLPGWKERATVILRAGDVKFAVLVPVEVEVPE